MIILEQLIVILGLILTNGLIPWTGLSLPAYQAVLSVAKFQTFETVAVRGGEQMQTRNIRNWIMNIIQKNE